MKKCYVNVKDEVYCQISGLEPQDHQSLYDKFGIMVEGAFFMPAFKLGRWDGRIRFFDKTGKIYHRLLDEVIPYLEHWGYEIELNDLRNPVAPVETRIDEEWFFRKPEHTLGVKLRPYQVDAVNKALDATSGFVIAATSSGKTWMIAGLCDVMNVNTRRCLVIVPSSDLVTQTIATFKLGNLDVGVYSGAEKDIHHMTVVATWQSLGRNPVLMQDFDCVIVDEAHGAAASTISDLINNHGKNCAFRFGFTGTFPKPKIDQMSLRGSIGEILYEISAADLMRMNYVAKVEIEPIEIQEAVDEEFPDYQSEKTYISKSARRLDLIADLAISGQQKYGNTLILVNSVKMGKELQKLIKDSVFLYGNTDNEVRAEWYHTFDNVDDLIVIATFGIASTGISIDRIFHLMMVDSGKSFIRAIQSIGRSIRKADGKDVAHVTDVHSKLKWSKKHFRERKKYYTEAQYPMTKVVKISV